MIAQAILESGWGQSTLTTQANNMFGIKGSYNGQYVEMRTMEDDGNGNLYEIVAKFRKYPSLKESFEDNAHVLKRLFFTRRLFLQWGLKSNTSSYRDATQWLQGRYATDTTYAGKLNNLIETYNLTHNLIPRPVAAAGMATTPIIQNKRSISNSRPWQR